MRTKNKVLTSIIVVIILLFVLACNHGPKPNGPGSTELPAQWKSVIPSSAPARK